MALKSCSQRENQQLRHISRLFSMGGTVESAQTVENAQKSGSSSIQIHWGQYDPVKIEGHKIERPKEVPVVKSELLSSAWVEKAKQKPQPKFTDSDVSSSESVTSDTPTTAPAVQTPSLDELMAQAQAVPNKPESPVRSKTVPKKKRTNWKRIL